MYNIDVNGNYRELPTVDSLGLMTDQARWETYKVVRKAQKEIDIEPISALMDFPSDEKEDIRDRLEFCSIQYGLWDGLKKIQSIFEKTSQVEYIDSAYQTLLSEFFIENIHYRLLSEDIELTQSFPADFYKVEQTYADELEDTAVVAPRRIGSLKVRVKGRSGIKPFEIKDEFQVSEDDWVDTAAVAPKKVGSCKVRIRNRKQLKPITLPGEFTTQNQV